MTSPSPYAYVFEDGEPDTPWIALKEYKALFRLHTEYWGRPIQGNELEPEQLQTPSEGQPMDDDEDQSEVGPGCFILNFDIKPFPTTKLWIRKDYIRMYDHCHQYVNDVRNSELQGEVPPIPPSVVITGQPGIGEYFSS